MLQFIKDAREIRKKNTVDYKILTLIHKSINFILNEDNY